MNKEIKVNIYKDEDMIKVFGRVIRNSKDNVPMITVITFLQ